MSYRFLPYMLIVKLSLIPPSLEVDLYYTYTYYSIFTSSCVHFIVSVAIRSMMSGCEFEMPRLLVVSNDEDVAARVYQ